MVVVFRAAGRCSRSSSVLGGAGRADMGRRRGASGCHEGNPVMADPRCCWVTNGMRTATAEKSLFRERREAFLLVRRKSLRAAEGICRERKKSPSGTGEEGITGREAAPRAGSQDRGRTSAARCNPGAQSPGAATASGRRAGCGCRGRRAVGKGCSCGRSQPGRIRQRQRSRWCAGVVALRVEWLAKAAHAINRPAIGGRMVSP